MVLGKRGVRPSGHYLSADEIWLLQSGDTTTIEGVTIDQKVVDFDPSKSDSTPRKVLDVGRLYKLG